MSGIIELPDDHEEPPQQKTASGPPPAQNAAPKPSAAAAGPELPPDMVDVRNKDLDELVADLRKTPLFMRSIDDAGDEENPELEAIKALMYEDPRAETAENFREQGNEMAKAKRWRDGKEMYEKGLAALKRERREGEPSGKDEDEKEKRIAEILRVNRALCHLELKNYRSATLDCLAALELNPSNIKAHYRMALALFSLGKLSEALRACDAGLAVDSKNSALNSLRKKTVAAQATADAAEAKKKAAAAEVEGEKRALAQALATRKITVRKSGPDTPRPDLPGDAQMRLVPDPDAPKKPPTLVFPVIVLYPLSAESDVIQAFGEEQTLAGHLEYLLPLPWDTKGEYTAKGVEAYLETKDGGLVKWGKSVELLRVLSGGKVEVKDGIVQVFIVPSKRAGEFIDMVRASKKK